MIHPAEMTVAQPQARIEDLTREANEFKIEANRYRWLHDHAGNTPGTRPVVVLVDSDDKLIFGDVLTAYRSGKQLDAFIDRFKNVEHFSISGVHPHRPEPFDYEMPMAVVMDAGRNGRILCELQAELPPVGSQIFARRSLSSLP